MKRKMYSQYQEAFERICDKINSECKNVSFHTNTSYNTATNDIMSMENRKSNTISFIFSKNRNDPHAVTTDPSAKRTSYVFTIPDLGSNAIRSMRGLSTRSENSIQSVSVFSSNVKENAYGDNTTDIHQYDDIGYELSASTAMMLNQTTFQYMFENNNVSTNTFMQLHQTDFRDADTLRANSEFSELGGIFNHLMWGLPRSIVMHSKEGNEDIVNSHIETLNMFIRGNIHEIHDYAPQLSIDEIENAKMSFKQCAYICAQRANVVDRLDYNIDDVLGFNKLYERLKEIDDKIEQDPSYIPDMQDIAGRNGDKDVIMALSSLIVYKGMRNKSLVAGDHGIMLNDDAYNNLGKNTSCRINKSQLDLKEFEYIYKTRYDLQDVVSCYHKIYLSGMSETQNEQNNALHLGYIENNNMQKVNIKFDERIKKTRVADYEAYRLFYCKVNNMMTDRNEYNVPIAAFKAFDIPRGEIRCKTMMDHEYDARLKTISFDDLEVILHDGDKQIVMSMDTFVTGSDEQGKILEGRPAELRKQMISCMPAFKSIEHKTNDLKSAFVDAYNMASKYKMQAGEYEQFNSQIDLVNFDYAIFKDREHKLKKTIDSEIKNLKKQRVMEDAGDVIYNYEKRHLTGIASEKTGYMDFGELAKNISETGYVDNPVRELNIRMKIYDVYKESKQLRHEFTSEEIADRCADIQTAEMCEKFMRSMYGVSRKEPITEKGDLLDRAYVYAYSANCINGMTQFAATDANSNTIRTTFGLNDYMLMLRAYDVKSLADCKTVFSDVTHAYVGAEGEGIRTLTTGVNADGEKIIRVISHDKTARQFKDEDMLYRPQSASEVTALNYFYKSGVVTFDDARGVSQDAKGFQTVISRCADKYMSVEGNDLNPLIEKLTAQALSADSFSNHTGVDVIDILKSIQNTNDESQMVKEFEDEKAKYSSTKAMYAILERENAEDNSKTQESEFQNPIKF